MRAWDGSNYLTPSANDNPDGFRRFLERSRDELDVRLFIAQGINPPPRYPRSQTEAQCRIVAETEGVSLGGYVYPFYANGLHDCLARLDTLAPFRDHMAFLALDLEDTSAPQLDWEYKADMTDAWLAECDNFAAELPEPQTGIYTGEGVWDGIGFPASLNRWADRWCWWASYVRNGSVNTLPDIVASKPLVTRGGFTSLVMRQYLGSASTFAGFTGFDSNVVLSEWMEGLMPRLPDVGEDYWSKFGPEGNNTLADRFDWPSVAKNLEGIINSVQQQVADPRARDTVEDIRQVLLRNGY